MGLRQSSIFTEVLMQPEFKVETTESDGFVRIAVEGELDLATVALLEAEVRRVEATEAELIVIDVSALTFMDSTGLRLLIEAHLRSQQTGNRLRIIEGSVSVQKLLRLTELAEKLPIIQSADL